MYTIIFNKYKTHIFQYDSRYYIGYPDCPWCGGKLEIKDGKRGEFLGCSNFPDCKFSKDMEPEHKILIGEECPECGAELEIKDSFKGEFISCVNFPKCRYSRDIDLGYGYCPDCGNPVSRKAKACPNCGCPVVSMTPDGVVRIKLSNLINTMTRQSVSIKGENGQDLWRGNAGQIAEFYLERQTQITIKYHTAAMHGEGHVRV